MVGVFELFKIGIGPSSSHTVGPMLAALSFGRSLKAAGLLAATANVTVTLFGSLAWTGKGHATDRAVILGLAGEAPGHDRPRPRRGNPGCGEPGSPADAAGGSRRRVRPGPRHRLRHGRDPAAPPQHAAFRGARGGWRPAVRRELVLGRRRLRAARGRGRRRPSATGRRSRTGSAAAPNSWPWARPAGSPWPRS